MLFNPGREDAAEHLLGIKVAGKRQEGHESHAPGSALVGALRSQRLSVMQQSASPVPPALPAIAVGSQQTPEHSPAR